MLRVLVALGLVLTVVLAATATPSEQVTTYRVDRVVDGDTIRLRNGQSVRLVQIDTPEVFFGTECYGRQSSATTKRLLPAGTRARLLPEPATDRVDDFGRLLRYVIRVRDRLNVNLEIVALGAGAPWFYEGRRGRYASELELFATMWSACPRTRYDPYMALETRR